MPASRVPPQGLTRRSRPKADDSHSAVERGDGALDLPEWWMGTCERDIEKTLPKAESYGSGGQDMIDLGRDVAEMTGMVCPEGVEQDQWHGEIGCYVYIRGKLTRAKEAFRTGRLPSYDNLFDITVYSMMQRRIRETGHWG